MVIGTASAPCDNRSQGIAGSIAENELIFCFFFLRVLLPSLLSTRIHWTQDLSTMGISRTGLFKRRATGGRQRPLRSKRKYELGRPPANTKLGEQKIHEVRVRGGHKKFRALKLDHGNFAWPGEAVTRKTRILTVVYNATSNEMVRTNTLVKGCIVQVDSTPFKTWYQKYYGVQLGKPVKVCIISIQTSVFWFLSLCQIRFLTLCLKEKEEKKDAEAKPADKPAEAEAKKSKSVLKKLAKRNKIRVLEGSLADQFNTGRLYAKLASRPGQSGRADGYILEGEELAFYQKKVCHSVLLISSTNSFFLADPQEEEVNPHLTSKLNKNRALCPNIKSCVCFPLAKTRMCFRFSC